MTRLLFPGRHHLLSSFQLEALTLATSGSPAQLADVNGRPLGIEEPIDTVLWAVTSANHSNTRRNPLGAHRREAAIEEFADLLDAQSFVYLIDDVGTTPRFAEYVLKKIEVESQGRFRLTPGDTVVGCSTPAVIELYEALGFRILPFELADRRTHSFRAPTPWELLMQIVEAGLAGRDWRTEEVFLTKVSRATRRMFLKYSFGDLLVDLHRRPLLTEDGDLTETRNYNTYVRSFDEGAERKYAQVREYVRPGRIVDVGCCTGSILRQMTLDDRLRESDFYGVEVARPLFAECQHRKEQGAFANENVFFYQRDFAAGPIFAPHSIDTFTTFSLTHEIESYLGRAELLGFLRLLFEQLAVGGRWINLDVVGPDEPERRVWMWLNRDDGAAPPAEGSPPGATREERKAALDQLSTWSRFAQFARDFRREEGYRVAYETRERDGRTYVELSLCDAAEFLSKKDYTDNWQSEMHETFCFWSFPRWCEALRDAGFRVLDGSHAFVNPWIATNRYEGKAALFTHSDGRLAPLEWPPTNMILVAERR
jgi:hypothetical protein